MNNFSTDWNTALVSDSLGGKSIAPDIELGGADHEQAVAQFDDFLQDHQSIEPDGIISLIRPVDEAHKSVDNAFLKAMQNPTSDNLYEVVHLMGEEAKTQTAAAKISTGVFKAVNMLVGMQ